MGEKLWKATERKVARVLGGQRVPVTGRARCGGYVLWEPGRWFCILCG